MAVLKNLTGQRFGRLLVKQRVSSKGGSRWLCMCDCGNESIVFNSNLMSGRTKSCGCLMVESRSKGNNTKHGNAKGGLSPEYRIWAGMMGRCNIKSSSAFARYGGRGITVCDEWRDFERFLMDMGNKPGPEYTIDRINGSLGYSKGNCRWATYVTQANNMKSNRRIEFLGKNMTMSEWAREAGMEVSTLYQRIDKLGWNPVRAIMTPVRTMQRKQKEVKNG